MTKLALLGRKRGNLFLTFLAIIAITIISCKKELFEQGKREPIDPVQAKKIAEYLQGPKMNKLSFNKFKVQTDLSRLGTIGQMLSTTSLKAKTMSVVTPETYSGFSINTDSVTVVTNGNRTSYIFTVKLSNPRAIVFQNLTVEVSPERTLTFINTYTPTKKWIADWKKGKPGKFEGEISVTYLNGDAPVSQVMSRANDNNATTKSTQAKVMGNVQQDLTANKVMLMRTDCFTTTYYYFEPYQCGGAGHHWPWEAGDCDYAGYISGMAPGWSIESIDITDCYTYDDGVGGGGGAGNGGGGGGGGTSPTPPTDFDPCDGPPPIGPVSVHSGATGAKLMVHADPDCNPMPPVLPPTQAQQLINLLQITNIRLINFLNDPLNSALVAEISYYMANSRNSAYSYEFARWAIGFLEQNPTFNFSSTFEDDAFSGLDYPPSNIAEEALINNGIEILDIPVNAPQNQNRIIGGAPKRHGDNPEDLQYGTNGNTTGILGSMIGKTDQQLFNSMRNLLWQTSVLSPDMRTVTSLMADRFENKTGGVFENAILTDAVKRSVQFQNFLKLFGDRLGKELTDNQGDISKIDALKTNDIRPTFGGLWNKFGGLQIAINDTEAHEIKLLNFSTYGGVLWTADIEVTIYDNFGLDKNDALTYQGKHSGFAAWWLLQHTRGYKPFQTKFVIKTRIEGRY